MKEMNRNQQKNKLVGSAVDRQRGAVDRRRGAEVRSVVFTTTMIAMLMVQFPT